MSFLRIWLLLCATACVVGFSTLQQASLPRQHFQSSRSAVGQNDDESKCPARRSLIGTALIGGLGLPWTKPASADDDDESFAAIAARASKLSTAIGESAPAVTRPSGDDRTIYDFELPVQGVDVPIKDIIRQTYDEEGRPKVKALLVVNMKEDDPVARKDIPGFIALAAK